MSKGRKVLTTGEVARICNVAPRTVSKWFDTGKIRGYRIPGSRDRRIPIDELQRFLKQHNMPAEGLGVDHTRVLILADDTTDTRRLQDELSTRPGYNVEWADNPFAAGLALQRLDPHVLVVRLGDTFDVIDVCKAVRTYDDWQATRIIALADNSTKAGIPSAARKLFDDCLGNWDDYLGLVSKIEHTLAIIY
ncbi:helix-turn-helix domain-containing protein [Planctomycetota bacterium]